VSRAEHGSGEAGRAAPVRPGPHGKRPTRRCHSATVDRPERGQGHGRPFEPLS
jgi:hypothetical protein